MMTRSSWETRLMLNWERDAVALPARRALMQKEDAFEYLCSLGREWPGHRGGSPRVHFATERGETEVDAEVFPRRTDGSFEGYYLRVATARGSSSSLLYVRNVTREVRGLAKEVDEVVVPLWVSGLRWRHIEVELYVGRYDWTAIGVHREQCGNIHQVLYGAKTMMVWPPHAVSARDGEPGCAVGGASYDDALTAGLLERGKCASFTARAGEGIYLPSAHWHVGVSTSLSVSLDLSLYGAYSTTASGWTRDR